VVHPFLNIKAEIFSWLRYPTLFLAFAAMKCNGQVLEAETATLIGTSVSTQRTGFSGSGYVTGLDETGDKLTVTTSVKKGVYNLYVRYTSISGDKMNFIVVNNENLGSVAFTMSHSFQETKVGKIHLTDGENTIAIVKDWGYIDVDNFRLEVSSPTDFTSNLTTNLVNSNASVKADSLYQFLRSTYGKVILSGQYGGTNEFSKIQTASGRIPVIKGLDLMDYSPSRVERGATSDATERAIDWGKQKGIVTLCWHWNAPKDLIDAPGKEWWRGFYTEATTFDVGIAMSDNQSQEYNLILRDIDAIAVQLKKIQNADIPVLWRPLHEAEGKWFWWGAKGPDACKWLWKLLYTRLVNHHQVNNLIWVWTSTDKATALEWYPGDAYVDLIGADIYLPPANYSSYYIAFDNLVNLYGGKKIISLSENGVLPDAAKMFLQSAAWSWFATWSGNFISDGVSNSTEKIREVFNNDYVITLDEIGDIASIILQLEEKRKHLEEQQIVSIEKESPPLIEYQNPISKSLVIKFPQKVDSLLIYDSKGKVVEEIRELKNPLEAQVDFENRTEGIYIIKIFARDFAKTIRVLKK
jgi:mannan endo-1,4-beta-mannosidase